MNVYRHPSSKYKSAIGCQTNGKLRPNMYQYWYALFFYFLLLYIIILIIIVIATTTINYVTKYNSLESNFV